MPVGADPAPQSEAIHAGLKVDVAQYRIHERAIAERFDSLPRPVCFDDTETLVHEQGGRDFQNQVVIVDKEHDRSAPGPRFMLCRGLRQRLARSLTTGRPRRYHGPKDGPTETRPSSKSSLRVGFAIEAPAVAPGISSTGRTDRL